MPKIVDYPRASLKASLKLAEAVQELGGTCTAGMAAEKLGKKMGGGFKAVISAATKYGFVTHKGGRLSVTPLFRNYRLAYSTDEQEKVLRTAYLSVPLFREIFDRFKGQKLPVDHFEKLLIREFGVQDQIASRVALYFLDGAKQIGLLKPDQTLRVSEAVGLTAGTGPVSDDQGDDDRDEQDAVQSVGADVSAVYTKGYSIRIFGPGIDSVIAINEEQDIEIIELMLSRIKKKLKEVSEGGKD